MNKDHGYRLKDDGQLIPSAVFFLAYGQHASAILSLVPLIVYSRQPLGFLCLLIGGYKRET